MLDASLHERFVVALLQLPRRVCVGIGEKFGFEVTGRA